LSSDPTCVYTGVAVPDFGVLDHVAVGFHRWL
jgi:hypothetical protein